MKSRIVLGAMLIGMGLLIAKPLLAGELEKKALDHEVYTVWNRILDQGISRDGRWAYWEMSPEQADGSLGVRSTSMDPEYRFERGRHAEFSHDSRHLVFLVQPEFEEVRQARLDDLSDEDKPKAELAVLDLGSGDKQTFERVRSFALPEESGRWLAYLHGLMPDSADG